MCVAAGLECTSKCLESWRRWKGGRSCILLSDYLDFFFQQVYFTFLGGSITSFIVQSSRQMDTSPVGSGSSLPGLVLLGKQKYGTLHEFACHPCAGAMLISVSFQF